MHIITVIIIAVGLSFDSFAVSLGCGAMQSSISLRKAVKIALIMALFQGIFPVIGFYMGYYVQEYVESIDHWIAFGLLVFLGFKMIFDSMRKHPHRKKKDIVKISTVITMAVCTSIDSMAVGISFAFIYKRIWFEALTIALITFFASMIAIRLGKSAGTKLGPRVEKIGGLLLIAIGVKILLEHTCLI